jgi:hypothetical protein
MTLFYKLIGLFSSVFLLLSFTSFAQSSFSINGVVENEKGDPIESATVFLSGTTRITKTNASGRFELKGLSPGSYDVVISILGYSSQKVNALINSTNVTKNIVLASKDIQLKEVRIGKEPRRDKYLSTFFDTFIGTSTNAAFCTITNPQVIQFSTNGSILQAFSDEFIIVTNKRLGYKISYLLRDFTFDTKSTTTVYDGECVFENLKGTEAQQKKWATNRLQAYRGSFMHFLRTLYSGRSVAEGFVTYDNGLVQYRLVDSIVNVRNYVTRPNKNFINLQFIQFKVIYAGKYLGSELNVNLIDPFRLASLPTSYAFSFVNKIVIDKRGSYEDYKSFRLEGAWGEKRLGDQLPFEYEPK